MNTLYKDGLIEVTDEEVIFHCYYFPFGTDKHLPLGRIERVEMRSPSIWLGSWRLWGGGPGIWFPMDGARPSRDAIFVATVRGAFTRVGFTVEHSKEAAAVFQKLGLLREPPS